MIIDVKKCNNIYKRVIEECNRMENISYYCEDRIVRFRSKSYGSDEWKIETEILICDGYEYVWLNDWSETQEYIEILWCKTLDEVK